MIKIRKFRKEDISEVALLIVNTFKKFNSKEYFKKSAIKEYLNQYDPKKHTIEELYEKFKKSTIFYVATSDNKIIGMIRGRPDRITNLYVDGKYHKRGVGRLLLTKFEAEAKKLKSKEIKVRSSLYAAPFYEKMGYKKTTGVRNFHGLKIYPTKKVIN